MALSRKELRDGFKAFLQTAYPSFVVSTSRIEDLREIKNAILVTVENVDIDYQLNGEPDYEAQVNVRYMKRNGTDDELDVVAETIEGVIATQSPALLGRRAAVLENISYDDFEQATNAITLSYRVAL